MIESVFISDIDGYMFCLRSVSKFYFYCFFIYLFLFFIIFFMYIMKDLIVIYSWHQVFVCMHCSELLFNIFVFS